MKNEEIFYFDPRICVIGRGNHVQPLVGLFSTKYKTTGFELNGTLNCSGNIEDICRCNLYIITVTTPDDLNSASKIVGKVISGGDILIYDSTIYPDVISDECIHTVEKVSGLEYNIQFFACFRLHTVGKTSKTTCRCSPEVCKIVDEIYSSVTKEECYV